MNRDRFSSTEERLAAIKQLCKGYGEVLVQVDFSTNLWKAEAPVRLDDNFNITTSGVGITPSIAIDDLWNKLTFDKIRLSYPGKPTITMKWDKIRWVSLGVMETAENDAA